MNKFLKILAFLLVIQTVYPNFQSSDENKTVEAIRLNPPLKIDGKLTEKLYETPATSDFIQRDPIEGAAPTQKTEFWIGYDDKAIYVGARLHDTSPDSIICLLGRRDADLKSDWFYIAFDCYYDRRTAFYFGVNPAGSIGDGTFYNDSWSDNVWDGIWDRAVSIDDYGWNVEMCIPYSQLRFTKKDENIWGINLLRIIGRNNEEIFYKMIPKNESGFVSKFATLNGIKNITPPARIEILPYAVSGGEFMNSYSEGDPLNKKSEFKKNLGADIKIGVGSNLTLDATINPDFGQVEVDPAEVNLTQFETYYTEKRPFFIEGANIFNFGLGGVANNFNFNWMHPQFFYSRRIGRAPQRDDLPDFNNSPKTTTILGAAKVSGKLDANQSVGVLAAITEREWADISEEGKRYKLEVEPLTFYGIARTQYEFKEGYYGLGYLLTSVERDLRDPELKNLLNRRAYTLGNDGWLFLDKDRTWVTNGWIGATYIAGTKERLLDLQTGHQHYFQRPDAKHVSIDSSLTSLIGYGGRFMINKQKGNWKFNSAIGFLSPSFEINDVGFQNRADYLNGHIITGYDWFKPDNTFRYKGLFAATSRSYDFGGNKTNELYFIWYGGKFLNYWGFEGNFIYSLRATNVRNTRGGPKMISPAGYNYYIYGYSDSRKAISFYLNFYEYRGEFGSKELSFGPGLIWKPASTIKFTLSPSYNFNYDLSQYIDTYYDLTASDTYGYRYIFGELNQKTIVASIRLDWTFTPSLSLQLYLQPLISVGKYSNIKELAKPNSYDFNIYGRNGSTIELDSDNYYVIDPDGAGPARTILVENPDFNYKSLRGNLVLRWEYLPGSTLYFVWTQGRENEDNPGCFVVGRDFKDMLSGTSDNIFLIKATYWFSL